MADQAREHFAVTGGNWLVGRHLRGHLVRHGAVARGVVVDVGCGRSPYRPFFPNAKHYVRTDVYAADPEVIIADASALPFEAGSADMLLLFQMLGDIADLPMAMAEFARVLPPGGKALIYETTAYTEHDMPHDFWRVMPAGLAWAAEQAGLKLESLDNLGGLWARFGILTNTQIWAKLESVWVLKPLAWLGRLSTNLILGALDSIRGPSRLAPDYFAVLIKPAEAAS